MQNNPQNPHLRRAYIVRPKASLLVQLERLLGKECAESFGDPTVVMTAALPFEGKLEGYRVPILRKCKEAFMQALQEFEPFSNPSSRQEILGAHSSSVAEFDVWWTTEEVETLEIPTSW